ncbi:MAG: TonB-dependent receptor [Pseudomonadota bacterium]
MFPLKQRILFIHGAAALLIMSKGVTAAESVEEIRVVGITPNGTQQDLRKIPYAVQSAVAADIESAQALDLSDFMNQRLGSVNINSAQNNPLQPDVQYRGFTASPLLGLPQGLAVYQNGVRINEPLGDAVNWDLLPESAIAQIELISGSNPVFGLNTLGGALSLTMKNGFNFTGQQAEATGGSWGRRTANFESGANNGTWGYYANLSYFEEDGWRDLSESDALNFYSTLSWRDADRSSLDFNLQLGGSELTGNGTLPVGLLAEDRSAVFTAPDITENDMTMVAMNGSHTFTDTIEFSANAFWRDNTTDTFNGDGSDFEVCNFHGGGQALFDELDDLEDALEDQLDIELDEICEGEEDDIRNYDDLEELIETRAQFAGLEADDFEPENLTDELSGTGLLSDQAVNNISNRKQNSRGLQGQVLVTEDLFALPNQFVAGYSYFRGASDFNSVLELAKLDPVTRSTQGLGVGTFVDEAATDIETLTETYSLFFTNTLEVTPELALTFAGRFNDTDITLRDQSGERPELNGDHAFARFNPAVGFTFNPGVSTTLYGSYSEANRVPTPIELACNEGVFELARQFAIEEGEDPDDVEFECRLPNAFLADPPLDDVVTRTYEFGLRGMWEAINYQVGYFTSRNEDDILFQTTGRATGLFANVDETARDGIELVLNGSLGQLNWFGSYSWIEATFGDDFTVLSPNHPNANEDGELAVESGDRIPGLPEYIGKIGGDYRVSEQLSIGAEVMYNSDQVLRGDEANELGTIGGYTLMNLRANLSLTPGLVLFARVSNVFDRKYENFGLLGEDPSEILPDLDDTTPYFLGAGAPRAAWVGVKYKFK